MARNLPRTASRLLNQLFKLCWLVPLRVSDDERIIRAIYSPYHVKGNKLKREAYDPTPRTDEISIMRIEYMGPHFCKRRAQASENLEQKPKKEYRGFAVLRVRAVRNSDMNVIDSRKHYCGHADTKFLMEELRNRVPNEPLSAKAGKRFKDLKDCLLEASNYVPDPDPRGRRWRGGKLEPPAGT